MSKFEPRYRSAVAEVMPILALYVSDIGTSYKPLNLEPEWWKVLHARLRAALAVENANMADVVKALQEHGYWLHTELASHAAWMMQAGERATAPGEQRRSVPEEARMTGIGRRIVEGGRKGGNRRSGQRKVRNVSAPVLELRRRWEKARAQGSPISLTALRRRVAKDFGISVSTPLNHEKEVDDKNGV